MSAVPRISQGVLGLIVLTVAGAAREPWDLRVEPVAGAFRKHG
ncbi:hypothetical protein AB0L65_14700 [Nonomuraea sp. NPDC052116]